MNEWWRVFFLALWCCAVADPRLVVGPANLEEVRVMDDNTENLFAAIAALIAESKQHAFASGSANTLAVSAGTFSGREMRAAGHQVSRSGD